MRIFPNRGFQYVVPRRFVRSLAILCTLTLAVIIFGTTTSSASASAWEDPAVYTISDTPGGGDCSKMGTWNPATKTCRLNQSFSVHAKYAIEIASDNITLDGNFRTIHHEAAPNGPFPGPFATVRMYGLTDVTVKNLYIDYILSGFDGYTGISVGLSSGVLLEGNYISTNSPNSDYFGRGIYLSGKSSVIRHNTFKNNTLGLTIWGDSSVRGSVKRQFGLPYNYIYRNNFINNTIQAVNDFLPGGYGGELWLNLFTHEQLGGNYWSDFDSEAEGCSDINADKFCDGPYEDNWFTDTKPWVLPGKWSYLSPNSNTNAQAHFPGWLGGAPESKKGPGGNQGNRSNPPFPEAPLQ